MRKSVVYRRLLCVCLISLLPESINLNLKRCEAAEDPQTPASPMKMEVDAEFQKEKHILTFAVENESERPIANVQVSVRRSLDLKEPLHRLGVTNRRGKFQVNTAAASLQPNCWFIFEKSGFRPYVVFWRRIMSDALAKLLSAGTTLTVTYPDGKSVNIVAGGQPGRNEMSTFHYYASGATISGLNLKWARRGASYVFYRPTAQQAAEEVLDLLVAQERVLTQRRFPVMPMGVILTEPPVSVAPEKGKLEGVWVEGIPTFPMPYSEREDVKQHLKQSLYSLLVHERVEIVLASDFEMVDVRWFREGVAEWMGVRVMLHLLGSADVYLNAYEAAFKEERTRPQQPLNLIEWSGANSDALYLAALAQVEEIDRKVGEGWLQSVLVNWALTAYTNKQRPSSKTLIAILNSLVGEDIEKRLKAVNFADCLRVIREMKGK